MSEIQVEDYLVEWYDDKAEQNFKKHKIRFEIAARVFLDDYRFDDYDEIQSNDEDRIKLSDVREKF